MHKNRTVLLRKHLWVFMAATVFAVDRITKSMVVHYLTLGEPVNILPMFNLFFTFNTGAAFGFLNKAGGWQRWLFAAVAICASISLIVWQLRVPAKCQRSKIVIALILGGTLGNLYDRIIYHKVIDFIDIFYKNWHYPIFNVADIAICIGATMLILDILRQDGQGR